MNKQTATSSKPAPLSWAATKPSVIEIAEQIEKIVQARAGELFEAACVEVIEGRFRETGFFPQRSEKTHPQKMRRENVFVDNSPAIPVGQKIGAKRFREEQQ